MRVLLVRCTNGIVAWRLFPTRSNSATNAKCLNDAFTVSNNLTLDADAVDFLQSIAVHSAALRGPVQTVTQIELPQ